MSDPSSGPSSDPSHAGGDSGDLGAAGAAGPPRAALLAVDLGLRCGLAYYDRDAVLLRHASRHFGGRDALRRGAVALLSEQPALEWLVVEGDARLARAWQRPAAARGIALLHVEPATWRRALLLERQQARGRDLKREAQRAAAKVVAASKAVSGTAPRHDAAEAILIGLWACGELGWGEGGIPG